VIGLREANIGFREANIGFHEANIGFHEAMSGLREAMSGLHDAMSGLHDAMSGLHDAMSGLHDALSRLREAMNGLHEAMSGLHDARRQLEPRDAELIVAEPSALLDGFVFTLDTNLAETGTEPPRAYAWAKHFAKNSAGVSLRPYLAIMQRAVRKSINPRKAAPKPFPPTTPPAQGFLAPNLANRNTARHPDDDLPENFRRALDAVSDDED
jgi:hypothetical protein